MIKAFMWVFRIVFGLSCLLFFSLNHAHSQTLDSLKNRKSIVIIGSASAYGLSLIGLNQLWYKDYERTSFQFFNDNKEWLQVDKLGHTYSTYILSQSSASLYRWAGFNRKQAAWYASGGSFLFLTGIELMDAHSSEWGFSWGDFAANTVGNGIFLAQEIGWQEQKIRLKFSYTPSDYREFRPNLLGDSELQGLFKDYNGQTYWLSVNPSAVGLQLKPAWLNFSVGMGGDAMISANRGDYLGLPNYHDRQWYLAPDIDFERIPTQKKWLKTAFTLLNALKFPTPALEFRTNGKSQFHWIQF